MTRQLPQNTRLLSLILLATMAQGATAEELMVRAQSLLPCPTSPNCVSTMATEESQAMAPYRFPDTSV